MSLESSASSWDGISFWFVAIGATLAFVGAVAGIQARRLNRRLTTEKTETARREKEAKDRAIADAGVRASEANARAAEANLELERLKSPRSLNLSQTINLVNDLKNIPKQSVEVFALMPDSEMVWTADMITQRLCDAGWQARPNRNRRIPAATFVNGVTVEIQAGADSPVRESAVALTRALSRAGIQATGPNPSYTFLTDAKIEIVVGNKPW